MFSENVQVQEEPTDNLCKFQKELEYLINKRPI